MKKAMCTLLALLMACSLFGCKQKGKASASAAARPAETATEATETATVTEAAAASTTEATVPETTKETQPTVHVHQWGDWVTTKEPTTSAKGVNTRTCSTCQETETQEIAKLKPSHVHSYKTEVIAPTCEKTGSTRHYCSCGSVYWDSKTAALGHKWSDWTVTKAATETNTGTKSRSCSVCQKTESSEIPKLNHQHSYTTKTVAATCTEDGYTLHTCACGDSYKDTAVKAPGHKWSDWKTTKNPTETAAGEKVRTCSACHTSETQTIAKLDHKHVYTDKVVAPTCTTGGYTEHTCSCGNSYKDNQTSATGHKFGDWVITKQPTESETGVKTRTCSVCNQTEAASIDKAQHEHYLVEVERQEATCTEDGYVIKACSCGNLSVKSTLPAGHKWEHHHEDAQGHYTPATITCHCGWSCSADIDYGAAFLAHVESVPAEDRYNHSYYPTGGDFVVDVPAKDWYVCTVCGETKE